MSQRHQILLKQLENGDLNDDEWLTVADELYKHGLLEDWQLLPYAEDSGRMMIGL